jgi:hypothetical protein
MEERTVPVGPVERVDVSDRRSLRARAVCTALGIPPMTGGPRSRGSDDVRAYLHGRVIYRAEMCVAVAALAPCSDVTIEVCVRRLTLGTDAIEPSGGLAGKAQEDQL